MLPHWWLFLLTGCVTDEMVKPLYDADGDGFYVAEASAIGEAGPFDCDDGDGDVHPGATEICDGVDNDCDGATDDGGDRRTVYADGDGDGHGDERVSELACDVPSGWATSSDDCDDGRADVFPGATEVCDGADQDCDGETDEDAADAVTFYGDSDGDGYGNDLFTASACQAPTGYVADAGDCDDADEAVHPDADEVCNGEDDDCDGATDPDGGVVDGATWYADADGDGYGDPTVSELACAKPAGWVADATDCDDTAASRNPGRVEHCDGVDEDCDGTADDDPVDPTEWHPDVDGDGFGALNSSLYACVAPTGYIADGTDCADSDSTAHPGGTEYCDGVDDDCNGTVDDAAVDATTWYVDADGDGYGSVDTTKAACSLPSGYAGNADDCDDSTSAAAPGLTETCNDGLDNDCDGSDDGCDLSGTVALTDADFLLSDTNRNGAGYHVSVGDINGDGTLDLASEVPSYGVVAYTGPAAGWSGSSAAAPAGYLATGSIAAYAGGRLCDLESDGRSGAIVGWGDPSSTGATYYFETLKAGASVSSASLTLTGDTGTYAFSAACDDLTGDGNVDLILGMPFFGPPAMTGAVMIVPGPVAALGSTYDFTTGSSHYEIAGSMMSGRELGTGDVDGDGFDDLLLSSSTSADLLIGPVVASDTVSSASDATYSTAYDVSSLSIGDVGNDGYADLLIGTSTDKTMGSGAGAAFLIYGSALPGSASLSSSPVAIYGDTAGDGAGFSVSVVGDIDGDGNGDFAIGANGDSSVASKSGAVGLYYGPPASGTTTLSSADFRVQGTAASDYLCAIGPAVDMDNDGLYDLVIGASGYDGGSTNGGAFAVFFGAGM